MYINKRIQLSTHQMSKIFLRKILTVMFFYKSVEVHTSASAYVIPVYPTITPRVFHVELTWKQLFPRRFNVEYT